ncbi:MAG: hypothetical protein KA313_10140 [Pseudarcicella sp.]|nr:hypothetical protein [Pseudarcicella sp.]
MKNSRTKFLSFLSVVLIVGVSITYAIKSKNTVNQDNVFNGKISFSDSNSHFISTSNIQVSQSFERGNPLLTLVVTDEKTTESIFVKLFNANQVGTYFIPGDGDFQNTGNLIKALDNYRDVANFYQTTLPNKDRMKNGVGRVNITKLNKELIEGELIIIANNSEGKQAILESAKFKSYFKNSLF